mgnify:CR=1 FL=1
MTNIRDNVRKVIEESINEILELNGEPPVSFTEATCPIRDIGHFDSLSSLEATASICSRLNIEWSDVSLMICPQRNISLNIGEITERVSKLVQS